MLIKYHDLSRDLYKTASATRDVKAVEGSVEQGSPRPIVKRAERRLVYRWAAQLARSLTK